MNNYSIKQLTFKLLWNYIKLFSLSYFTKQICYKNLLTLVGQIFSAFYSTLQQKKFLRIFGELLMCFRVASSFFKLRWALSSQMWSRSKLLSKELNISFVDVLLRAVECLWPSCSTFHTTIKACVCVVTRTIERFRQSCGWNSWDSTLRKTV